MAHYALINESGIVEHVIVGKDEGEEGIDWEAQYSKISGMVCKRTSYNTFGNKHLKGGQPFRGNYAGPGYFYDSSRDAFIPPRPYPSWVLDEGSFTWAPPVPRPESDIPLNWDEDLQQWIAASND